MNAALGYDRVRFLLSENLMGHKEQLRELLRRKSLKYGKFILSSGKESDYYLDCKLTTLDPEGALLTGYAILELLKEKHIEADAIGGPAIGAIPILTAVSLVSPKVGKPLPAFFVRKEPKQHGRGKQVEGIELPPGARVVIVDEVCTTGESTLDALRVVENQKLEVVAVISLVDREQGGSDILREKYPYMTVFTAKELLGSAPVSVTSESGKVVS